jgi:hypothetical protein
MEKNIEKENPFGRPKMIWEGIIITFILVKF